MNTKIYSRLFWVVLLLCASFAFATTPAQATDHAAPAGHEMDADQGDDQHAMPADAEDEEMIQDEEHMEE